MKIILNNQLGFTLPEIMIGSAIMVGVALAGATIFKNQARSQARVDNDQMLSVYHAALSKTLNSVSHCNATFKTYWNRPEVPANGVSFATNPTAIRLCDGGPTCALDVDAENVSPSPIPFIRPGNWIDWSNGASRQIWRLTDVTFANTLTSSGTLRLRFTYTMNPRIENRTVVKDLSVNLRFSTGSPAKFKECFNDQEISINNLQNDICHAMFSATGELVQWNEEMQTCELKGSPVAPVKTCSTTGLMVEGIRSDGIVNCRALSEGFSPDSVTDPTSCIADSKVQLVWDGSKVRVVCVP